MTFLDKIKEARKKAPAGHPRRTKLGTHTAPKKKNISLRALQSHVSEESAHEPLNLDEARQLRAELQELKSTADFCFWSMCSRLARIANTEIIGQRGKTVVAAWGYTCFEDYCATELGLHRKQAYRMVKVWEVFGEVFAGVVPDEWLERLGRCKLRAFSPLSAVPERRREVLDLAKRALNPSMTYLKIQAEVASILRKDGRTVKDPTARKRVSFTVDLKGEKVVRNWHEAAEALGITPGKRIVELLSKDLKALSH